MSDRTDRRSTATTRDIEYGRFDDPQPGRVYVVTASLLPGSIRVWHVQDDREPVLVCTIGGLASRPYASWNADWIAQMRHWKTWLVDRAVIAYRSYRATTPVLVRDCDG